MDNVKEAFSRVKEDIAILSEELFYLKKELKETRETLIELCELIKKIKIKTEEKDKSSYNQENIKNQAEVNKKEADSTYIQADMDVFKPLKGQNLAISIRNQGVPTVSQSVSQTDVLFKKKDKIDNLQETLATLNNLDSFKKELRFKFKRLTEQEFSVFSKIFELEETLGFIEYKDLAKNLNLTEGSIRDYISKLIKKGVPIIKTKTNNKVILLSISPQLKNIISLETLIKLRDL